MGKKFLPETEPELIKFCLNCKQKRCRGECDEFKKAKEELWRKREYNK